jgi:hypothetical protein
MITNEALRILTNQLAFTKRVNRHYDQSFGVEGAKIGTTLNVRKPVRYLVSQGPALTIQDITETTVPVTLTTQAVVGISFTSQDLKLSIDEFSKRLIQPAVAAIANQIDFDGMGLYRQVYNYVAESALSPVPAWTPGAVPQRLLTYLNAGVALDNNACPQDGQRSVIINPQMQATIVDALKGLFHSGDELEKQYKKGHMGVAAGFEWAQDQNTWTHTTGNVYPSSNASTPEIGTSLVAAGGATIYASGFYANSTLVVGDIIQIAGVYQVNPQNHQSTNVLQPFVVTAPTGLMTGTNDAIQISPAIVTSGAYQNVTAAPLLNAAITVFGQGAGAPLNGIAGASTPQGLAFHPDAFTLACADLPLPEGVDMAARASDEDTGLSLRMVRQYDINTDKWPCRVDVLYGWAALRPELACRILS